MEVARRAGVGVGTVSRVLNESPLVTEATRSRVLAVIEELDYRPSAVAQRLSRGRTQTVGIVVPAFTRPSAVERLRGLVEVIGRSRYDLVLFAIETREQRDEHLRNLARGDRADGLVIISLTPTDEEVDRFVRAGVAAVLIDARHPRLAHLVVDDVLGGRLATEHLLALGHRRIAFVGDQTTNPFGFTSSTNRLQGYRQAMEAAGVSLRAGYLRHGPHGREIAHRLTDELLSLPERPTAVFAASDTQAMGVLEAAGMAGLRVPDDLSVIGFDDIEIAPYVGLTTVRQPLAASGARAAAIVLDLLERGECDGEEHGLPLAVVPRRTTAAPAGSASARRPGPV